MRDRKHGRLGSSSDGGDTAMALLMGRAEGNAGIDLAGAHLDALYDPRARASTNASMQVKEQYLRFVSWRYGNDIAQGLGGDRPAIVD